MLRQITKLPFHVACLGAVACLQDGITAFGEVSLQLRDESGSPGT